MKAFFIAVLFLVLSLTCSAETKSKKIRGYVTQVNSATSFEIEDYRITRDLSIVLELEKAEDDEEPVKFDPRDVRVGTELEIKGDYNEETGELRARSIKVFLDEHTRVKRTALIERAPNLIKDERGWSGSFFVDGQRVDVGPSTAVVFKPNKSEKKAAKDARKKGEDSRTENEDLRPLSSMDEVGSNVFLSYEGQRKKDGRIDATKLTFVKNELEDGEAKFWRSLDSKEKAPDFAGLKPGELQIKRVGKFKLLPNKEVQTYVSSVGQKLIPAVAGMEKIPFKFYVIENKTPNAFATANGIVVIHSSMLELLENEDQLAAVLGHEIAHSVQEHTWRQMQYHRKKLMALKIGGLVAGGFGYGGIQDIATMVELAVRNGYGRSLENQADRIGLQYLMDAGYDPRQAPRVWKVMTLKMGDAPTNFFYSDHDNNTTRRSYLMAELRNNYAETDLLSRSPRDQDYQRMVTLLKESVNKKARLKVKH